MEPTPPAMSNFSVPLAIVVAGALIAVAIYFVGQSPATGTTPTDTTSDVPPVTAEDHRLGSPDAPITIIEYSDLDCPFCKQFHATMKEIMNEYGAAGKVAWVYRNFPLAQLHPNAPKLAEASECVAEQLGNEGYWKFLDVLFTHAPLNEKTDMTKIADYAGEAGVSDIAAFQSCFDSGRMSEKVQKEFNDAVASGGQGTPHNILITKSGKAIPIAGAQPYATVKSIIDAALE
ncbi:MAG: thioredoxin domain-containing protein [Patescibacteria group bacterium]